MEYAEFTNIGIISILGLKRNLAVNQLPVSLARYDMPLIAKVLLFVLWVHSESRKQKNDLIIRKSAWMDNFHTGRFFDKTVSNHNNCRLFPGRAQGLAMFVPARGASHGGNAVEPAQSNTRFVKDNFFASTKIIEISKAVIRFALLIFVIHPLPNALCTASQYQSYLLVECEIQNTHVAKAIGAK